MFFELLFSKCVSQLHNQAHLPGLLVGMEPSDDAANILLDIHDLPHRGIYRAPRRMSHHFDRDLTQVIPSVEVDLLGSLADLSAAGETCTALEAMGETTLIKRHGKTKREKDYKSNWEMQEKAIRLSFKMHAEKGGMWHRGWAQEVMRKTGIIAKTIKRWCEKFAGVDEALAAARARGKGPGTLTPPAVEKRLYNHIIQCWRSGSTPTRRAWLADIANHVIQALGSRVKWYSKTRV